MDKLSIILNFGKMKKITNKEIREIAENIVEKTNESTNDFDAVEDITQVLKNMLINMKVAVEEIKKNPNCGCSDCKCDN